VFPLARPGASPIRELTTLSAFAGGGWWRGPRLTDAGRREPPVLAEFGSRLPLSLEGPVCRSLGGGLSIIGLLARVLHDARHGSRVTSDTPAVAPIAPPGWKWSLSDLRRVRGIRYWTGGRPMKRRVLAGSVAATRSSEAREARGTARVGGSPASPPGRKSLTLMRVGGTPAGVIHSLSQWSRGRAARSS
jgi:hypothetical protein